MGAPQLPSAAALAARGLRNVNRRLIKGDVVQLSDVSLSMQPAKSDALVWCVGADAVAIWELLTEAAPDDAMARTPTVPIPSPA
jgi:hypothetical protein